MLHYCRHTLQGSPPKAVKQKVKLPAAVQDALDAVKRTFPGSKTKPIQATRTMAAEDWASAMESDDRSIDIVRDTSPADLYSTM